MASIRVLLTGDHQLYRRSLRQICEVKGGFHVVGEAADGQEAVRLAAELEPDVILMDINMPVLSGIRAITRILKTTPGARIIALTIASQDLGVLDALQAGAKGYLLKDSDAQVIVQTVRAVHEGEALMSPVLTARLLREYRRLGQTTDDPPQIVQLTEAEMAVLRLVARGADDQAIGEQLGLSPQAVSSYLRSTYQKLQINNRTQAGLYALREGLVSLED